MLDRLINTGAVRVPWPAMLNGALLPTEMAEAEICKQKCQSGRVCATQKTAGEYICKQGMSYFVIPVEEGAITVFGVRGNLNSPPFPRHLKESLKGRLVTTEALNTWISTLENLRKVAEQVFLSRQSEMLDPLHDPMRLAKQVNTIANKLVQQQPLGKTFDERVERSSVELKSLVKASGLLTDSFELIAVYFNPAAASFGAQNAINIHGLLKKLVSIFRIDDGGLTQNHAKIFLDGECFRNIFARESFKLIPFSLLANAVKYSLAGSIKVTINDLRTSVEVGVESIGPYIEEDEREKIFLKRKRGKWAEKLTNEGRGVGLYLAQIIANAHGFEIKVSSRRTGEWHSEVPLAQNRFSFEIPTNRT